MMIVRRQRHVVLRRWKNGGYEGPRIFLSAGASRPTDS
jgi:hypothetical protein